MNRIKTILIPLVLILAAATLGARGNSEDTEPLEELNISYVKSPFNLQVMVMKELGLLEKEFEDDGIRVNWHEITSGAKQAEAMAAGSLEIASVMNTASVIIANAAGNEVDVIGIVSRPERTFAIMVRDDGPASVRDLEGAVVAGPKGTVLHQLLESVIAKEGLEDVSLVSMGLPQAQAALLSGDVDAALLAASLVLKTQDAGGRILTTSEGYVTPLLVSVSPQGFTENHPEIIERYRAVHQAAYDFIIENTEEAVAIGAEAQGLGFDDATDLYERSGIADEFTAADLESLGGDVGFLLDLGMIENDVEPASLLAPGVYVQ